MNDQRQAEPIQVADEQMRQLNDIDWLRQHPATDIEGDGWVEAGNGLQPYVARLKQLSAQDVSNMKMQVRLLAIFLPVLRDWLVSWELGASFEAVYIEAQKLLFHQIQQATAAQASWIEAVLAAHPQGAQAAHLQGQLQLREKLTEILTQDNWHALATIAAHDIEQRVLKRAQPHIEIKTTL